MSQDKTHVSSSIPLQDQKDLVWFFGRGLAAFERSTFGYQLERAETFTFGTKRCVKCKGTGYLESPEQSIQKAIDAVLAYQAKHATQIVAGTMPRLPPGYLDESRKPRPGVDGSCDQCLGSGWVPRNRRHARRGALTARPMGFEVRYLTEPNTDELELYGMMSHRTSRLTRDTVMTLAGFFGVGPRWADDKRIGQVHGLLSLTPAGKTLLKQSRKKTNNEDRLPDDVVLATEVELEGTQSKPNRRQLIDAARKQAGERLQGADAEWLAALDVEEPKPRRAPRAALPKALRAQRVRVAELRLENVRRVRELVEVTRVA